jgi:hypothetical protein
MRLSVQERVGMKCYAWPRAQGVKEVNNHHIRFWTDCNSGFKNIDKEIFLVQLGLVMELKGAGFCARLHTPFIRLQAEGLVQIHSDVHALTLEPSMLTNLYV